MTKEALKIEDTPSRLLCVRCFRSKAVCLCDAIQPFAPFFKTVLLQHPKERKNSIGTARFTHLTLSNSKLIVGFGFDDDSAVNQLIDSPENYCVVLFPGPHSINVAEAKEEFLKQIPLQANGEKKTLVIFVIDGTWAHARAMLRRSKRICSLPRISFTLDLPSQYKVRKQPRSYCLSTVEAVARLIYLLDEKAPSSRLLATFSSMVDLQLKYGALKKRRS